MGLSTRWGIMVAAGMGCTGKDSDTGEVSFEQGVDGLLVKRDAACAMPEAVSIYDALPTSGACDWSPTFDTGLAETGHWTDNVGDEVATPAVVGDRFAAPLSAGDFEARVFDECYGCVAFSVAEGAVTDVALDLQELVFVDAPNVYLYPPVPQTVRVRLGQARHIVAAEPDYPPGGWQVEAHPDGRLVLDGTVHDFLFYELKSGAGRLQTEAGWCVRGHLAQSSIEEAMALSGFLENEIVDFSDFWDGYWPAAPWMTVFPQTEFLGALVIDPPPDSVLRLWFVVEDGCQVVDEPILPNVQRWGFDVAEWGVIFDRRYPRTWDPLR